jgi:flagellar motor switch protein FliM
MLQISAPNEIIILMVFNVRVGESKGTMNVALPASMIEAAGKNFTQGWRTRKEPSTTDRAHLAENLGRVPLSVAAVLDTTMNGSDLLELQPGDLIVLDRDARDSLDVQVSGSSKFGARLKRNDYRAALLIESMAHVPTLEGAA